LLLKTVVVVNYIPKIAWLLLLATVSYGQTIVPLSADFQGITIENSYLVQLKTPPDYLTSPAPLPTGLSQWKPVESINYGRRYFIGWARFAVRSTQPRTVWLELTTHFMDSVGVWTAAPNALPQRVRGPSSHREQATTLAPVNHRYFLYALNLPANQLVTVWIRGSVVPGDALKFGVRLWQPKRFLAVQQQDIWGWAMFWGIVLAILGGVLIAFLFYRRTLYLLYACYVVCLSVYASLNDGWGAFLPNSLADFDQIATIVHWMNIGFGAFVLFSRRFLAVPSRLGRLFLFRWPEAIPFIVIMSSVLLAEWAQQHNHSPLLLLIYPVGYAGFGGYGLLWLIYVINAFRRKYTIVWLLIAAVATLLLFFSANTFLINSALITNPLPDMAVLRIALLVELLILSAGWLYRRKLLQMARQELEIQNRALQADVIQTQETERQRIAQDLHDDLGGTLATIRQRLADMGQRTTDPPTQRAFAELEPLILKGGQDLRRIAHNLMPPDFDRLGLADSIEQFVRAIPAKPTRFEFVLAGKPQKLSIATELNVYRIVSELVQNIQKHANANRASVQLLYEKNELVVLIDDNGMGISPEKLSNGTGIGLKNATLRANYIGATVQRETGEGGTFVVLTVPYLPPNYANQLSA
jgi:signal transduction histidine kinase